ncbi:MAG: hypothetical protein ACOC0W_02210 [Desulfosalsimonas sp.]
MRPALYPAVLFLSVFVTVSVVMPALAGDNEIFGAAGKKLEPNILIIFDNSKSMEINRLEIDKNRKECRKCEWAEWEAGRGCLASRMDIAKNTVKDLIENYAAENRFGIMVFNGMDGDGSHEGDLPDGGHIPYHEGSYGTELAGRFAVCSAKDTFISGSDGREKTGASRQKAIESYKKFLKDAVDQIESLENIGTPLAETLAEAGRYFAGKESLFNPGEEKYPLSGTYPDPEVRDYSLHQSHLPTGFWCRKNYVILMTDGEPWYDNAGVLADEPYMDGSFLPSSGLYSYKAGKYYEKDRPELHDVAGFLHDNDIHAELENTQNIVTYTIGFSEGVDKEAGSLLQDTADRGGGHGDCPKEDDGGLFFYARGRPELSGAFEAIMENITEASAIFAPAEIPVSEQNMAYTGDYGYVSMFKPQAGNKRWKGNLKKYRLNSENQFVSCEGGSEPVIGEDGFIKDDAVSCWSGSADGGRVDAGGAGEVLSRTADERRNIYSNISEDKPLYWPGNEFRRDNENLEPETFGDEDKGRLIDRIRMKNEDWKLGDINHSAPEAVTWDSGERYIFAGSNDGMLHCFDDSDGSEKWAFVPSEQFGRLQEAYTGNHSWFMDGSPAAGETKDNEKILICGERRGGNHYYALNITDIDEPEYLYTHTTGDSSCAGPSCRGQSWKTPQFIRTAVSESRAKDAFLITGGYDPAYDDDSYLPQDPSGNSVYAIEAETGREIFRFDDSRPELSEMKHSIVSAFAADTVDDGKKIISRIYAADLGGNVFGFRDGESSNAPDGDWQAMHLFSCGFSGRKIFYEADFTRKYMQYFDRKEKKWNTVTGDMVYFGTGDRTSPLRTDTENAFYCIKNDWHTKSLDTKTRVKERDTLYNPELAGNELKEEKVLKDVTDNLIQDGTAEQRRRVREALFHRSNRGWYIRFEKGEKCLSAPTVYKGVVYFTTFVPDPDSGMEGDNDPCTSGEAGGETRLYAIDHITGGAVYSNFGKDPSDQSPAPGQPQKPSRQDRYMVLDSSLIPLGISPRIVITEEGTSVAVFPETRRIRDQGGIDLLYWKQR